MPEGGALVAALKTTLPAGIALAAQDPLAGSWGLLPGEGLDNAAPKRLAEFAAGRRAAHAAMAMLDFPPVAIPHGSDRAPQWPNGVTGSISHTEGLCLAMVGRSDAWAALGLDLEADRDLDPALWPEILRPEELARINLLPEPQRGQASMAAFAAKEAVYKAQYPTSRTLLDFQALNITLRDQNFDSRFTQDVPGFAKGAKMQGQFCRADGFIAAFCAIRRAAVA